MNLEFEARELRRQLQKRDYELEKSQNQFQDQLNKYDVLSVTLKQQFFTQITDLEQSYARDKERMRLEISDLMKQLTQVREEKQKEIRYLQDTNAELQDKLKDQSKVIEVKQRMYESQESEMKELELKIQKMMQEKLLLSQQNNKINDKAANLDVINRQNKQLIEKLEYSLEQHQSSKNQNSNRDLFVQSNTKQEQDVQTMETFSDEEIKILKQQFESQSVDLLAVKLKLNEKEGLLSAVQKHNLALMDRLSSLAHRIEIMSFQTVYAEKIKNEFYGLCRDYIDKKKMIQERHVLMNVQMNQIKDENKDLQVQRDHFQLTMNELRAQIQELFKELDYEANSRLVIDSQKSEYKNKVRLANQRIKSLTKMIDDVGVKVLDRLFNSDLGKEMQKIDEFQDKVIQLQAKIKIKEEDIKSEIAYSKKWVDYD